VGALKRGASKILKVKVDLKEKKRLKKSKRTQSETAGGEKKNQATLEKAKKESGCTTG